MVKVEHISKSYGKKKVLLDICFEAKPGERVAIVGSNGCGKTTLMRILSGAMKPKSGEISYFSINPIKENRIFYEKCGYVPQDLPLIEELNVRDNLKLWEVNRSEAYESILDDFDLREILKVRVSDLSGGMKRRLAIACALGKMPPILLLDEPTSALDLAYREKILGYLQAFKAKGGIVIMTTHDEVEIATADRCLFMKDGMLEELTVDETLIARIKEKL